MIGLVTAVIGDVAGHLGCFIFLRDSVNAIAFVALGTSVPGTSASESIRACQYAQSVKVHVLCNLSPLTSIRHAWIY